VLFLCALRPLPSLRPIGTYLRAIFIGLHTRLLNRRPSVFGVQFCWPFPRQHYLLFSPSLLRPLGVVLSFSSLPVPIFSFLAPAAGLRLMRSCSRSTIYCRHRKFSSVPIVPPSSPYHSSVESHSLALKNRTNIFTVIKFQKVRYC
jgi:hypothetical protein